MTISRDELIESIQRLRHEVANTDTQKGWNAAIDTVCYELRKPLCKPGSISAQIASLKVGESLSLSKPRVRAAVAYEVGRKFGMKFSVSNGNPQVITRLA